MLDCLASSLLALVKCLVPKALSLICDGTDATAVAAAAMCHDAGPLIKLKPSPNCVALADGHSCVMRRKIAADNSCLFNAVGYAMHRSMSRAPYLRNVVSRDVSSDPQVYYSCCRFCCCCCCC
eukprot:jgi/Chrzof1/1281/Cz10g01030.t1